jgi:hypothetical protein
MQQKVLGKIQDGGPLKIINNAQHHKTKPVPIIEPSFHPC